MALYTRHYHAEQWTYYIHIIYLSIEYITNLNLTQYKVFVSTIRAANMSNIIVILNRQCMQTELSVHNMCTCVHSVLYTIY